jgi:hypothetical protein
MPDTSTDPIAATLAAYPEIAGHLTTVDELDDDAAIVDQVVEYAARRSGENQGPGGRQ